MNNYYVSAGRGSDSTGTGTASNPWKTIAKAIGASPAASLGSDGARVYLEPGTYYESVTLGLTPTATARLEVVGDCDGAGFLAGGLATPATGVVDWSSWVNDTTARGMPCLAGGNKSYVSLRRLKLIGGAIDKSCVDVGAGHDWTISDCIVVPHSSQPAIVFGSAAAPAAAGLNAVVERCDFHVGGNSSGRPIMFNVAGAAAEYSLDSVVRNCRFRGGVLIVARVANTGLGYAATGLQISHCSFLGGHSAPISVYGSDPVVLASPITVFGCYLSGNNGIVAGHVSQVTEDYNAFHVASAARLNVTAGSHSIGSVRPAFDYGDGRLVGTPLRPWGEPVANSLLGGFVVGGASPTTDFAGRARPEGYLSTRAAVGALERHDTGEINTPYADSGSPACLALRGPSSLERPILMDATATVIRVKVRWDGNHGDANKPQAILLANPEIGVSADQVVTASSSGGTGSTPNEYETLSFSSVTPTRPGALMLRLVSRSSDGTGVAYFDSITLS
ncbi:MAG: hypothetical protein BGO49_17475 [Planctomycetales bacterium 71-10]|nr:MAG: hypothetical protein BGO49_17475 [Planctomycetales bacterium 71-10]